MGSSYRNLKNIGLVFSIAVILMVVGLPPRAEDKSEDSLALRWSEDFEQGVYNKCKEPLFEISNSAARSGVQALSFLLNNEGLVDKQVEDGCYVARHGERVEQQFVAGHPYLVGFSIRLPSLGLVPASDGDTIVVPVVGIVNEDGDPEIFLQLTIDGDKNDLVFVRHHRNSLGELNVEKVATIPAELDRWMDFEVGFSRSLIKEGKQAGWTKVWQGGDLIGEAIGPNMLVGRLGWTDGSGLLVSGFVGESLPKVEQVGYDIDAIIVSTLTGILGSSDLAESEEAGLRMIAETRQISEVVKAEPFDLSERILNNEARLLPPGGVVISPPTLKPNPSTIVTSPSYGFWDQGFRQAIVRSELGSISQITMGQCLYPTGSPCPAGVSCGACQTDGDTNYQQSNFFSTVSPAPADNYWILDHNVDVGTFGGAFDSTCLSGPPDQSWPVSPSLTASQVFGFTITDGTIGLRANMVLKNQYAQCSEKNPVPFIGFSASSRKGNGGRLPGYFIRSNSSNFGFNNDVSTAGFKSALTYCSPGAPCLYYFYVYAMINDKPKMLILTLGHINHPGSQHQAHWNWPVRESYFYPGYDIAYLRCDTVGVPCMSVDSAGRYYELSISRLLTLASDLNLYDESISVGTRVSIEGVGVAMETAGPNENRGWVEGLRIGQGAIPGVQFGDKFDFSGDSTLIPEETLYGRVRNLSATNAQSCLEVVGRPASQQNGEGWCLQNSNWQNMVSNSQPGSWSYANNEWRLTVSQTGTMFPKGIYKGFWRNGESGAIAMGTFEVIDSDSTMPRIYFSRNLDEATTSATLTQNETLYGKVSNLTATNAQSCLEVVGRPAGQVNGEGYCSNLAVWTTMVSSTAAGSWSYGSGVWRLTANPVGTLFPAGSYRGYWRNATTGQQAVGSFTVTAPPAPVVYFSKVLDGATTSVTLNQEEILYGKVNNLTATTTQSCLEVVGRPAGQVNGEGYCSNLAVWTNMVSSTAAGSWSYASGVWRLTANPVGTLFPPGSYRSYWRNTMTGQQAVGNITVPLPPAPVVYFSKVLDGATTSVSLTQNETLYGKVSNLTATNAQSCLEVVGRPAGQVNGEGYCSNLAVWTNMVSSTAAGSWSYGSGVWRLTANPVGTLFPAGSYRGYWRNATTGQQAVGNFTVTAPPAPVVYFAKVLDGATTSVTLNQEEILYGKVNNLTATTTQSCLEVVGRPAGQVNGEGYCSNLAVWTNMVSSTAPGSWSYVSGVWRLTANPVSSLFPSGSYRSYWRNTTTGQQAVGNITVSLPPAPVVYFSKVLDGATTSVSLTQNETLYGKVSNLTATNAQSCLEVVGRPAGQVNGEGYCSNLAVWTNMVSSTAAGSWSYGSGVWRLTANPVGTLFPAGSYRGYWRNATTGQQAVGIFTVTVPPAPVVYFSKVLDGATTSVTLSQEEILYGKVNNLTATTTQSCLEVVGRPAGQVNGEGYCSNLAVWTNMVSSTAAGSWSYVSGFWRLTANPVGTLFPPGSYRSYWRNKTTGQQSVGNITVSLPPAPVVYFSKVLDGATTSVSLTQNETLYGKVSNLTATNAQSCLEVVGRPAGQVNGEGYCGNLAVWTNMVSSTAAGSWSYGSSVWRLTANPVGTLFPAGSYRGYWRNKTTGQQAVGYFTVTVPPAPVVYFSKVLDGATTSVTLSQEEILYGKVNNLTATTTQSCLEVVGRPAGQVNGEGYCSNLAVWTNMVSSTAAGSWSYVSGVWRLTANPVSSLFPAGSYRSYWRNTTTGQQAVGNITVSLPPAPVVYFSKVLDGATTSVTLAQNEVLYGKVTNLTATNGQSCLEVVGRPAGQVNGEGYCSNLAVWTNMVSSTAAGSWSYGSSVWRLTTNPVSSLFPAGSYRGYWRNKTTGQQAVGYFTVTPPPAPVVYCSTYYDGNTTSTTMSTSQSLHAKVINLTGSNAQSCLEVRGRPAGQVNGVGWCNSLSNWTTMSSSSSANSWYYSGGVWRLVVSPVSTLFGAGTYDVFWRNSLTGQSAKGTFTVY